VFSDQADPKLVAYHEHKAFGGLEELGEKFGVAFEGNFFAMDCLFIHRRGYQCINETILQFF
jgi:hypothetical protein